MAHSAEGLTLGVSPGLWDRVHAGPGACLRLSLCLSKNKEKETESPPGRFLVRVWV